LGRSNQNKSDNRTVRRFTRSTIVLHWLHTAVFIVLAVTGAIILSQSGGFSDIYIAVLLHRAMAVIFIIMSIAICFLKPASTANFIRETFTWSREDFRWALAAPDYYFGGPEEKMPPQGHLNAGQKLWQAAIILTGLILVITGIILWGFRFSLPVSVNLWLLFVHAIAFIIVFLVLLLHIYLGVFHPRFRESLRSVLDGRMSPGYARAHYRKWYEKQSLITTDKSKIRSQSHSSKDQTE
jgi:formate dehydrogenase subunit gamma